MYLSLTRIALIVAVALLALACSKVTAENYAKIKSGMEYTEVTSILGNPASCDDVIGFKSCRWGDEKSHIIVRFAGDAVIMSSAENLR
jgi:outer membrane protein assembly factor BamE (lipoprotein component of BamABCDE complex)